MTAPQESIPAAANILGTIGTVILSCWCVQIIPQIWHNWRLKSTEGLPLSMVMLWAVCGVPYGVYAIVQNFNFALKFQPQCFAGLTLITWGQILYYGKKWSVMKSTIVTILVAISFAVSEAILIVTLRKPYYNGVEWPMMMMAIIASAMQALGLIPPYFEMAKRNGRLIGINFGFLTIDYAGAFFSLMALVAQNTFDALGGSMYIVCMLLESGMFISHWIWLWRVRHVRREAKKAGKTYDQYIAENPSKKLPRSESSESVPDLESGDGGSQGAVVTPEKSVAAPSRTEEVTVDIPAATEDNTIQYPEKIQDPHSRT